MNSRYFHRLFLLTESKIISVLWVGAFPAQRIKTDSGIAVIMK